MGEQEKCKGKEATLCLQLKTHFIVFPLFLAFHLSNKFQSNKMFSHMHKEKA